MSLDKLDVDPAQLLALVAGILLGYLCTVLAIDLSMYYVQSRVVTAELYKRLRDAEKGEPVSSPSRDPNTSVDLYATSSVQPSEPPVRASTPVAESR